MKKINSISNIHYDDFKKNISSKRMVFEKLNESCILNEKYDLEILSKMTNNIAEYLVILKDMINVIKTKIVGFDRDDNFVRNILDEIEIFSQTNPLPDTIIKRHLEELRLFMISKVHGSQEYVSKLDNIINDNVSLFTIGVSDKTYESYLENNVEQYLNKICIYENKNSYNISLEDTILLQDVIRDIDNNKELSNLTNIDKFILKENYNVTVVDINIDNNKYLVSLENNEPYIIYNEYNRYYKYDINNNTKTLLEE